MKLPDLQQYHIVKGQLLEVIENARDSESASEASSLITTMESTVQNRMDSAVWDAINVMVRVKNMLKAELETDQAT